MRRIGLAVALTICTLMLTACDPKPEAGPIPEEPIIFARVIDGRTLQIEGNTYTEESALRAKVAELQSRRPQPKLSILAEQDVPVEDVRRAVLLLRRAGVARIDVIKVGFITEPDGQVREREAQ